MSKIVELAPAKLNLYLRVINKRPDGYHDIETLFERIKLFDKIIVSDRRKNITIKCRSREIPSGGDNLCFRAAHLVQKRYNIARGVKITIIKKIPVAAGLGGGSSDAASTLKALNKLWKLSLGKGDLIELGRGIGADVAFFLTDSSFSIGRGKGDILESLKTERNLWHLVITPDIKLLSGDIYRLYSETRSLTLTKKRSIDKILLPTIHMSNMGQLEALLHNDLEDIVLAREPIIKDIKNAMASNGAKNTLVSGSGPSVFGIYETRKEALKAKKACFKRLPVSRGWRVFIAETH